MTRGYMQINRSLNKTETDGEDIHDWFYFENTVTRNMEICGLNSYIYARFNKHTFQINLIPSHCE